MRDLLDDEAREKGSIYAKAAARGRGEGCVAALPHPRSRRCAPSASSGPCPSSTRSGSARGATGGASSSPCPSGCRTRASQSSSARRGGSRRATTRSARWTGSSGSAHARVRRPPKASGLPRVVEATAEELGRRALPRPRRQGVGEQGGTAAESFATPPRTAELEELTRGPSRSSPDRPGRPMR
jgi:hypothetical protein